jgi:hypothetical protein
MSAGTLSPANVTDTGVTNNPPPDRPTGTNGEKAMKPVKISVFGVPSHVVFRPSGRLIRIHNEGRSLAESQREWLQHRLRQASLTEPVRQQRPLTSRITTSDNQPLFAGANVNLFCHSASDKVGVTSRPASVLAHRGGARPSGDRQAAASRRISRLSKPLGPQYLGTAAARFAAQS